MKYFYIILSILLVNSTLLKAQHERKYIRKGTDDYVAKNFGNSEVSYQKATELDSKLTLAWLFLAAEFIGEKDYEKGFSSIENALNIDSTLNDIFKPPIEQIREILKDLNEKLREKFIQRND